jgi:hypothetical protein
MDTTLRAVVLLLATHTAASTLPDARLCSRAGGIPANVDHIEPGLEALFELEAFRETANACHERGCVWSNADDACLYPASTAATASTPGADAGIPAAAALGAPNNVTVTTVHVIHSNHFDAGYTDGVINVINLYFDTYFPRAIKVGAELRESAPASFPDGLHWMTQVRNVGKGKRQSEESER